MENHVIIKIEVANIKEIFESTGMKPSPEAILKSLEMFTNIPIVVEIENKNNKNLFRWKESVPIGVVQHVTDVIDLNRIFCKVAFWTERYGYPIGTSALEFKIGDTEIVRGKTIVNEFVPMAICYKEMIK